MKKITILQYLIAGAIITVIFAVTYAAVQQGYRTAANDPQIQIARDINTRLRQGKPVDAFFADSVDITNSLSAFAIVYDVAGRPIRSSGYLDGKMLQLPAGVFDYARIHGAHEVTWQPRDGVRMAMAIVKTAAASIGFVASGRSLQEVELREHNLVTMMFIGWLVCIALLLMHALAYSYTGGQKPPVH